MLVKTLTNTHKCAKARKGGPIKINADRIKLGKNPINRQVTAYHNQYKTMAVRGCQL